MLRDLPDQRLAIGLRHPVARLDPLVGVDRGLKLILERMVRALVGCRHRPPPYRMFVRLMMTHRVCGRKRRRVPAEQAGGMIPSDTISTSCAGRRSEPGWPGLHHSIIELTMPDSRRAASHGSTPALTSPTATASATREAIVASKPRRRARAQ